MFGACIENRRHEKQSSQKDFTWEASVFVLPEGGVDKDTSNIIGSHSDLWKMHPESEWTFDSWSLIGVSVFV